MRIFSLLAVGLTAFLGVSFAVLNAQPVPVEYYVGHQTIPLSLLIVGVLVVGILLGMLILCPTLLRLKFEIRRLHRKVGT